MTLNKNLYSMSNSIEFYQDTFAKQGYLLLKSFIEREKILDIRRSIVKILAKRRWIVHGNDNAEVLLPIHNMGTPEFFACIQEIVMQERLHELFHDVQILNFLSNILNDNVFVHPRKTVRLTYPYRINKVDYVLPHQDFYYVKGEIDTLTLWIPLGDYSIKHGGLIINESSHKDGLLPVKPQSDVRYRCQVADIDIKKHLWKKTDYEMGDVLIMHSLTLHASGLNLNKEMRISTDARYSSSSGFISQRELVPPYYPNIASWDILNQNWSNKDIISVPDTVQIQDERITPEELFVQKKSIFVRE